MILRPLTKARRISQVLRARLIEPDEIKIKPNQSITGSDSSSSPKHSSTNARGINKIRSDTYNYTKLRDLFTDPYWKSSLQAEFEKTYFLKLERQLNFLWNRGITIYPPRSQIFAAFNATPLNHVRVVLIGQDPYHGPNQAHGLCFSVSPGVPPPPSLLNMYKELERDIPGFVTPSHGTLLSWAHQGVLMLNATLTVEAHKANSHSSIGWQTFTDAVIDYVNRKKKGVVFLLWGKFAQHKSTAIDKSKHYTIECAHPSPLSKKGWYGCRTFSRCNTALRDLELPEIDWKLPYKIENVARSQHSPHKSIYT